MYDSSHITKEATEMFRNDPDMGAVPAVGEGTVDVARRTICGEAAIWGPGADMEAVAAFLNDDTLVVVGATMYRRNADASLVPVTVPTRDVVLVRPPAGDWFTVEAAEFKEGFAIHVNVPTVLSTIGATRTVGAVVEVEPAKPAAVKKAAAKKVAAKK